MNPGLETGLSVFLIKNIDQSSLILLKKRSTQFPTQDWYTLKFSKSPNPPQPTPTQAAQPNPTHSQKFRDSKKFRVFGIFLHRFNFSVMIY